MNQYDILYLNMQQFLARARKQDMIEYLEQAVIEELKEAYGAFFPEHTNVLSAVLEKIYTKVDKQFGPRPHPGCKPARAP